MNDEKEKNSQRWAGPMMVTGSTSIIFLNHSSVKKGLHHQRIFASPFFFSPTDTTKKKQTEESAKAAEDNDHKAKRVS
jgi:hypothetical protein